MIWIKQFHAICNMTVREILREPLTLLLTIGCVLFIALLPVMITHVLGESGKLIRDSALAVLFTGGLFLSACIAGTVLAREVRKGTAAALLSKPVNRAVFFFAKAAGIFFIMLAFTLCLGMATLMSARAAREAFLIDRWAFIPLLTAPFAALVGGGLLNAFARHPFPSATSALLLLFLLLAFLFSGVANFGFDGQLHPFNTAYDWRLLPALALLALALLILSTAALSLSTRLDTLPVLFCCTLLFLLGLISDYAFGRHAGTTWSARILYSLIPNWQHFWTADALTGGGKIPWSYVGVVTRYAGWYMVGVLSLGLFSFRNVEAG